MTRPDPGATARHIELARPDKILAEDALPEDAREDGARDETGGAAALTVGLIKRRRLAAAKTADAADLITYWSALRHGAPFPAPEELNAHHVASRWPGSVLMRMIAGSPVLVRRYGMNTIGDGSGVVATMQIQWIQALTHEVMRAGCPLQDKTTFPAGTLGDGETQCSAIGVPLGSGGDVNHVLCWVRTGT